MTEGSEPLAATAFRSSHPPHAYWRKASSNRASELPAMQLGPQVVPSCGEPGEFGARDVPCIARHERIQGSWIFAEPA
jgi:hypothetical protein